MTLGQIVFYVERGGSPPIVLPAIITHIVSANRKVVTLTIFDRTGTLHSQASEMNQDPEKLQTGEWYE